MALSELYPTAVTLALVGAGCASSPIPSASHPMLGQRVSFALPSDQGTLVPIPQPGANVTVLDFFAPTCVPCRDKVPALDAKRNELAAVGARLVLVAVLASGEGSNDAAKELASWGVHAPFLVDRADVSRREAGVASLPATLIIDRAGVIRWSAPPNADAADVVASVPRD